MSDLQFHQIMWAELSPDVYAGPDCDEVKPQWYCFAEGDRGGEHMIEPLELSPEHFHPGTKVLVLEPQCAQCGQIATMCRDDEDCDFDWDDWVLCEYS